MILEKLVDLIQAALDRLVRPPVTTFITGKAYGENMIWLLRIFATAYIRLIIMGLRVR